jgi:negative modulator of initiation of replication
MQTASNFIKAPMRTIDIEDDLYEYLRTQQTTFGESASHVLRRLLKLGPPTDSNSHKGQPVPEWVPKLAEEVQRELEQNPRKKALWEFIKGPRFQSERNAVGRFLSVLAFVCRENREKFAVVESINGRSRKYFGKSDSELNKSGKSVHPKNIPGSDYWVVTNNSTQNKRELLMDVLRLLGYEGLSAYAAAKIDP